VERSFKRYLESLIEPKVSLHRVIEGFQRIGEECAFLHRRIDELERRLDAEYID